MNIHRRKGNGAISSKQEYLHWLGKYLLMFFPVNQVLEILSDYEEYLSPQDGLKKEEESMEDIVRQWGTPRHVLNVLLEENPQAKGYFYKWSVFWGAAMLLSFGLLFYVMQDLFLSLVLFPVFVFCFLHGRDQIRIEKYLSIKIHSPEKIFAVCLFLTATVLLLEGEIQYFINNIEEIPDYIGGIPIGLAIDREFAFFQFIILLLIVWMIKKAVTDFILYLSDTIYALGTMAFIAGIRNCLHNMNILMTEEIRMEFLFPVVYFGIGMAIAAGLKISAGLTGRHGLWTHR